MAPPVVQDSDEDDAFLDSPERAPETYAQTPSEVTSADPSIRSNERLAGALLMAHDNPVAPSPGGAIAISDGSISSISASLRSPTMSKVKRSRTTMDFLSSQRNKIRKTYGNKTTLDDMGLSETIVSGEWLFDHHDERSDIAFDVDGASSRKRKRGAASSGSGKSLEDMTNFSHSQAGHAKFSGKRKRLLGTPQSQESSIPNGSQGSTSLSQIVDTALEGLQAIDEGPISLQHELDREVEEMNQNQVDYSDPPINNQAHSLNSEVATDDELARDDHCTDAESLQATQGKTIHVDSEQESTQALPRRSIDVVSETRATQAKVNPTSKRRAPDIDQQDELSADHGRGDISLESYQPRPSRSRGSVLPNDFLAEIDFSKRPEAVLKGKKKIKRRKTTSDITVYVDDKEEETVVIDEKRRSTPGVSVVIPSDEKAIDQVAETQKKKRGRPKKQPTKELPGDEATEVGPGHEPANAAETGAAKLSEDLPKKRGRKRKIKKDPLADDDQEEQNSVDAPPTKYETEEEEDIFTLKKKHRRGKSSLFIGDKDEDNETDASELKAEDKDTKQGPHHFETKPAVLRENHTASNTRASPTATPSSKDDCAQPSKSVVPGAIETPKKATTTEGKPNGKGPDKHSPLNGGKMNYRVGLSRHARIEPLLRIVRK